MIVSTAGSGLAVQSSVGALGSVAAVAAVFPRSYCGSGHWSYAGIHIATIADTDLCREAVRATKHPKTNEKVATREVGVYGTVVRISVYSRLKVSITSSSKLEHDEIREQDFRFDERASPRATLANPTPQPSPLLRLVHDAPV